MRPFIDKDYSWKQCSTRENRSVHNFLLFHWRRHVKKLRFVLHQVPNACWWSKKPEFLTYDVKHSLLLRLFLNFELLHFESWNSWFIDFFLLVPRHRLRTKETIQPNNKPFTLSCWYYLRVYLVPRKTEKSFPLMLVCWDATRKKQTGRFVTRSAQIILHKDIETPNVAHLLCIWKVMTLKVNFKDLLLRSEAWKYHSKRPEKGRKVKMVRWMMTFHLRNRGYYMALRRH